MQQKENRMQLKFLRLCTVMAALMFLSVTVMTLNAEARAGGSRSMGSRGSRSYSRPAAPSSPQQNQYRQQQASPAPSPFQQPAGGGFLRSMAGGIAGGLLGGMLFRSLGMAGGGMGGGGGIGLFEIALLAGIGYLIYRFIKKKREENDVTPLQQNRSYQRDNVIPISTPQQNYQEISNDVETGLAHIRQFDAGFDENLFNDAVMDIFFKIQSAWMNRELSPVSALLTDEMRGIFQSDIDQLLREKRINRLENIAVRKVEIAEAWQESGNDFITASIYANLLDYTTDDASGTVVSGSKTEPVKFEEYWTFTRQVGNGSWKLSAINQK